MKSKKEKGNGYGVREDVQAVCQDFFEKNSGAEWILVAGNPPQVIYQMTKIIQKLAQRALGKAVEEYDKQAVEAVRKNFG